MMTMISYYSLGLNRVSPDKGISQYVRNDAHDVHDDHDDHDAHDDHDDHDAGDYEFLSAVYVLSGASGMLKAFLS